MKRVRVLPAITTTNASTCPTEQNKKDPKNQTFHDILKKFKKRRQTSKHQSKIPQTVQNIEYIDDDNEQNIQNEKILIKIYESKYSSLFEKMKKDFGATLAIKKGKVETSKSQMDNKGFSKFGMTNYSSPTTIKDFYKKYQSYNTLNRKQPLTQYTPSFAFIKSANEEMIVPNPLGLLKRKGDDYKIEMNNQKVGDSYIKVLSNSLKYSKHINTIQLKGNRMSSFGAKMLFTSLNQNKGLLYKIHTLDLSNNKIGKNNIDEMINYIKDPKCNLEYLDVSSNLLGDENIKKISDALAEFAQYRMVTVNYGNNQISDDSIPSICNMLTQCTGLRVLILNWNKLTNPGATQLMKKLRTHSELRILDLAWNNIGNDLTVEPKYEEIVNTDLTNPGRNMHNFELNETCRTMRFNFRRNPLLPPLDPKGGNKKPQKKNDPKAATKTGPLYKIPKPIPVPSTPVSPFSNELGQYFHETMISLIHLDISHNNLPTTDAKFLAEEIKDNHTILGIHVDGNEMTIDGLGFISPLESDKKEENYFANSQIYYELGKDFNLTKTNVDNVRKIRSKNNCWICEGWREVKFEFTPKEPIVDINSHLVKIHLSFDNFKSFDMLFVNGKFEIVRMCPPGEVHYFFTIDTVPVIQEDKGKSNDVIPLTKGTEFTYHFDEEYIDEWNNLQAKLNYEQNALNNPQDDITGELHLDPNVTNPNQTTQSLPQVEKKDDISVMITHLGKKVVKINHNVINDEYRKMIKFTEPRPVKIIDRFIKPRTPWTFPISIWAYYDYQYNGDSQDYINQCFEFDFKRCQFYKDVKEEDKFNELKAFLQERYKDIIDCYKYYSSFSGFSVWQITQNNLTEFISRCPGMCDKTYDINNIYLTQKVVCGNLLDRDEKINNKNKNLSDNIVRHQFMNLLVKAAKDKYVTSLKTTTDVLEAVKMSFETHYEPAIKGFEYHTWRKERYYNEQVDNFLKAYLPILDALYKSWAKQKGPRKKDVWMVLDEYNSLVQSFVDIDEYPIRDNPLYFNYSIRLQVNEINGDKHINMFFPEFLEALCRAVDKASPIPPDEQPEDWPKEKRAAQPLVNKLENVIGRLIKLITHPDYKYLREKFPMPQKDLATGLYIVNYDSPFYQGFIIKPRAPDAKRTIISVNTEDNL